VTRRFHRLRVAQARAQARIGFARLAVAIARRRVDEVWFGDSHAVLFNTSRFPFPGLAPVDERRWVWHLGPRLMYSTARDGFLPALLRLVRVLRRVPAGQAVTWFVSYGEIDIRCHLAERLRDGADLGFVDRYVDRVRELAGAVGLAEIVIVVPPPPAVDSLDHDAFPVVGTPEERIAARRAVADRLATAATQHQAPRIRILDLGPALADPHGLLRADLTDDGCHTNDAGRARVRSAVEEYLQTA